MTTLPTRPEDAVEDVPRALVYVRDPADRAFRAIARLGGAAVLAVMVFVAFFLAKNAVPALRKVGVWHFLTSPEWKVEQGDFGIASLLAGTVQIALVALLVSLPLSLGLALFVTEVAPGSFRRFLQHAIDLMAAIPSLVFGLWGLLMVENAAVPLAHWLSVNLGWIPIFHINGVDPNNPLFEPAMYKKSAFIAGLIVALMVIPIQTAVMVESFSRAPAGEREGAFALGATRWGVIRSVVLPFGKGGIIGGTMLGLGRALGETIAVYLIISPDFTLKGRILEKGTNSVAAHIAMQYNEAGDIAMSALMAAGLALFAMTMVVNFTASWIISRSRSGADSEG